MTLGHTLGYLDISKLIFKSLRCILDHLGTFFFFTILSHFSTESLIARCILDHFDTFFFFFFYHFKLF